MLTDFGFSTIVGDGDVALSHDRWGTTAYRAPELLDFSYDEAGHSRPAEVSRKSDIWAIGCILFKVASCNRACAFTSDYNVIAFKNRHEGHALPQLEEGHNKALCHAIWCPERDRVLPLWEQVNSMIKLCLAIDPEERPTALELSNRFEKMRKILLQDEGKESGPGLMPKVSEL